MRKTFFSRRVAAWRSFFHKNQKPPASPAKSSNGFALEEAGGLKAFAKFFLILYRN